MIATSGGLNQQRTGITDAVVVAHILNATLIIPKLDQKSFWKDSSNFSDIFDVDWFISYLSKDVKIISQLPMKGGKVVTPYTMRVPRKCPPTCYQNRVLPLLRKKHAVQLAKLDYRLANRLDMDLQKLRCRVNYHALMFTGPILEMRGVRIGSKDEDENQAFYCPALKIRNPDKERRQGKCPLNPEEVGLMLRALGFGSDGHVYVASGEVYGGEETLAPLKALFPNFHTKETLASKEELAPFSSYSSRMAALDFIVCDESDVFVTNNNGNMAKMLAGRRRYFGHKPTIRPNAKKLYRLFMNRDNMTWEEFASRVRTHQIGFMGEPNEVRPGKGEFHENPSSCICENLEGKAMGDTGSQNQATISPKNVCENNARKDIDEVNDEQFTEDDQDWSDPDYVENENGLQGEGLSSRRDSDSSLLLKFEQQELEELFSD